MHVFNTFAALTFPSGAQKFAVTLTSYSSDYYLLWNGLIRNELKVCSELLYTGISKILNIIQSLVTLTKLNIIKKGLIAFDCFRLTSDETM